MEYREYKPCELLSGFVECYWTAYADKPPFREHESLIPDGTIEMMFNFGDDYSQIKEGKRTLVKGSHIIGIRKESLRISQTNNQELFSVRFKLGGIYPFIRIPVYMYSNDFYGLDLLMGNEYRELEERLYNVRTDRGRVSIMEQYLLRKLQGKIPDEYEFVKAGLDHVIGSPSAGIKSLADRLNTNYRTLERRFENVVGLNPSELLKIRRFNKSVLLMYSCKYDSFTEIAYESGYYDQSHFIREFRQLTGLTPREFLKEQFTIVQVIQPALAGRLSKSYNL